ncbi:hypothetical protein [Streptomyces marincola]|uniref:Uncharacterized protein n=1 Tax=Streptomyces marincola TaxID=2878388 RepID=A0A1W7D0Q1_9ACTN|nr:hypothetical protein [Streptomyces marincola]ARQ70606.1 hypothetical protein CAG99_18730 [Streptomyces marincola]
MLFPDQRRLLLHIDRLDLHVIALAQALIPPAPAVDATMAPSAGGEVSSPPGPGDEQSSPERAGAGR